MEHLELPIDDIARRVNARVYTDEEGAKRIVLLTEAEESIRFLLDGLGAPTMQILHEAVEALDQLAECMEESDPYPTSDAHPLYEARRVLVAFGRRKAPEE